MFVKGFVSFLHGLPLLKKVSQYFVILIAFYNTVFICRLNGSRLYNHSFLPSQCARFLCSLFYSTKPTDCSNTGKYNTYQLHAKLSNRFGIEIFCFISPLKAAFISPHSNVRTFTEVLAVAFTASAKMHPCSSFQFHAFLCAHSPLQIASSISVLNNLYLHFLQPYFSIQILNCVCLLQVSFYFIPPGFSHPLNFIITFVLGKCKCSIVCFVLAGSLSTQASSRFKSCSYSVLYQDAKIFRLYNRCIEFNCHHFLCATAFRYNDFL